MFCFDLLFARRLKLKNIKKLFVCLNSHHAHQWKNKHDSKMMRGKEKSECLDVCAFVKVLIHLCFFLFYFGQQWHPLGKMFVNEYKERGSMSLARSISLLLWYSYWFVIFCGVSTQNSFITLWNIQVANFGSIL